MLLGCGNSGGKHFLLFSLYFLVPAFGHATTDQDFEVKIRKNLLLPKKIRFFFLISIFYDIVCTFLIFSRAGECHLPIVSCIDGGIYLVISHHLRACQDYSNILEHARVQHGNFKVLIVP